MRKEELLEYIEGLILAQLRVATTTEYVKLALKVVELKPEKTPVALEVTEQELEAIEPLSLS